MTCCARSTSGRRRRVAVPSTRTIRLADAATAIRVMGAAEHTGKLVLSVPDAGAAASWSHRSGLRSSAATAPTSSLAASAASGCSSRRGWPRRVAAGSCSPRRSEPIPKARRVHRRASVRPGPTSRSSAAISPKRPPRTGGSPWRPPPGFRCAVCCTQRRWSRTPPSPTSATSSSTGDWAPKVYGAWHLHNATADAATGLVLLLLIGSRPAGFPGPGRICCGQQLAGRIHTLAPRPGPARHSDRVGGVGRDRTRRVAWRKAARPR